MNKYYIQDTRQYVGNDILWWAIGGGYTCNIENAEVFDEDKAFDIFKNRESDKPWLKEYVDKHITKVVDSQNINFKESKTKLPKIKRAKPRVFRINCTHCGIKITIKHNGKEVQK